MRRGETVERALLVTVGLAVALALGELAVRFGPGRQIAWRSTAVEESHASEWHDPDFRPRPGGAPGPPFRVLVLGDSFAWGQGVYAEDAWPERLERLLAAAALPRRVEVSALARPGWSTPQEVAVLARQWPKIHPDLILLAYCLNDAEPPPGEDLDALRAPLHRRRPAGAVGWLVERSALGRFVWTRLENARQRRAFAAFYRRLYASQPGWSLTRAALDQLRDLAAERGVPVLLAIFPVFDGPLDRGYPYRETHRKVAEEARWRDFRVLDLLPAYRGVDPHRLALVPFTDAHPSELAHRLAAEALRDHLLAERLVTAPAPGERPPRRNLDPPRP